MSSTIKKSKKNIKGGFTIFKNKPYSWQLDNSKIKSIKSGLKIKKIDISCNLCNHDKFSKHKVLLPGGRFTLYSEMEWFTTSASTKLICERCTNIILIANEKALVKRKKGGKKLK